MSETNNRAPQERKDMTGSLWINDNKQQGDRQPSMRGFLKAGGKEYRVTAWTRYTQSGGRKYLSLSLQTLEDWQREAEAAKTAKAANGSAAAQAEDDMPF